MATANSNRNSSMSEEAYDLINCFYDGVDEIVLELAQEIAEKRGSFIEGDPTSVAVEVEDVKRAGRMVIDSLKNLVKRQELSDEMKDRIEGMGQCLGEQS